MRRRLLKEEGDFIICPECKEYVMWLFTGNYERYFLVKNNGEMSEDEWDNVRIEDYDSQQLVCACGNVRKYYEVDENDRLIRKTGIYKTNKKI